MEPRSCPERARSQEELWSKLNDQASAIKEGPIVLAPFADWIKGLSPEAEVGILAQELLGRLFKSDFHATQESWAAALSW